MNGGKSVEGLCEGACEANREELGQSLDRWQIIARDLISERIGEDKILSGQPLWIIKVWEELAEMPEMRINK
jgi:hypothetical protein